MSAPETKSHSCSCGRSFANEQILKYHQRVSNHPAAEESPLGATEAAPAAAPVAAVATPPVAAPAAAVSNDSSAALMAPEPTAPAARSRRTLAPSQPQAAAAVEEAPHCFEADFAEQAYLDAIEILRHKRAEQESFERSQAASQMIEEFVDFAGDMAAQGADALSTGMVLARQVASKVIILMVLILLTASMFSAGVGLVTLATAPSAPTGGGQFTLTTARI